jgi:hypothetical protein
MRLSACSFLLAITAALTVGWSTTAQASTVANPHRCFYITDGHGNVIDTICVPSPVTRSRT